MLDCGELGNLPWQSEPPPSPELEGELRADVAVVGGGLTGLSTAWHVRRSEGGKRVVLLEAARVGGGASHRAAGNCLDLVGEGVDQLVSQFGRAGAEQALAYGRDALAYVEAQSEPLAIPYTAPRAEFIDVAVSKSHVRLLERRLALLGELGFDGGRSWLDEAACRRRFAASPFLAGISFRHAKLADPRLLVRRWLELARGAGADVFEQSPVTRIDRRDGDFQLTTPAGSVIASHVVVATNAFAGGEIDGALARFQRPVWTYCLATEPIDAARWDEIGLDSKTSFYDANHLLHYFRRTDDDRLLFGGGEPGLEPSSAASLKHHTALLEARLRRYFPTLAEVRTDAAWCGPISITSELTPAINTFHDGRLFLSVGCIGHGLVSAQYNGKLIADVIRDGVQAARPFPFRVSKRWPGLGLDGVALRAVRTYLRARDSWNASAS